MVIPPAPSANTDLAPLVQPHTPSSTRLFLAYNIHPTGADQWLYVCMVRTRHADGSVSRWGRQIVTATGSQLGFN